jgi:hypothetical protein
MPQAPYTPWMAPPTGGGGAVGAGMVMAGGVPIAVTAWTPPGSSLPTAAPYATPAPAVGSPAMELPDKAAPVTYGPPSGVAVTQYAVPASLPVSGSPVGGGSGGSGGGGASDRRAMQDCSSLYVASAPMCGGACGYRHPGVRVKVRAHNCRGVLCDAIAAERAGCGGL